MESLEDRATKTVSWSTRKEERKKEILITKTVIKDRRKLTFD